MMFVARGVRVQKRVCHETVDEATDVVSYLYSRVLGRYDLLAPSEDIEMNFSTLEAPGIEKS